MELAPERLAENSNCRNVKLAINQIESVCSSGEARVFCSRPLACGSLRYNPEGREGGIKSGGFDTKSSRHCIPLNHPISYSNGLWCLRSTTRCLFQGMNAEGGACHAAFGEISRTRADEPSSRLMR